MLPPRIPLADKDPADKENGPTTAPDARVKPAAVDEDVDEDVAASYDEAFASASELMGEKKWRREMARVLARSGGAARHARPQPRPYRPKARSGA
jgi:hypothetical protein